MGNFSEIQGSKYYQYDFENKGNKWNVMIVWGKFNHVYVTKKSNNPFGGPLGKEFDTLGEAVDNYKDVNIKANILFAGNEAKEFGYNPEYAKGGAIEVGDWVSEIGGKARGQVYKKDGSFIFLKDKYGNEDNTMRFVNNYKHSGKPRYAGGGGVGNWEIWGAFYPYTSDYEPIGEYFATEKDANNRIPQLEKEYPGSKFYATTEEIQDKNEKFIDYIDQGETFQYRNGGGVGLTKAEKWFDRLRNYEREHLSKKYKYLNDTTKTHAEWVQKVYDIIKSKYSNGGGVGNKSTFLFTFPKGTNIRNAWVYLKENGVDADFEINQGVYVTTFDDGSKAVSLLNKSEYKYSNIKQVYAGGGRSKIYMNGREYRAKLNKMTDAELLKYYIDEYGFDPTDKDHAERIENERESVIDELVDEYVDYMKSTGRLYSGGGKTSTNSQVIKKLIKDLDNTPHSVGLALLRERLLSHAEIDLKALEKNPNEWSNPIYSSGMYKDLFTRIIKYLNFESGNGNNDVAVKKLIKNLDNTPYSVGLALLRERLLTYAQSDLKALEKNPKDWSNAFFTSGMYKDLFTRINDHLKFEFKEGGQTIDVTDLGAGDLAFITKTGERVKVLHRIDLIKLAVKNRQGKEFAIYEHQLTPIAKAHKKFAGGGNTDSEKNYIKTLHDTIRKISEKMEVYGESGYGGYVVYSSNQNQKLNIYNYKDLQPYSSQALEPVETKVSFMAPNKTAIIFDNLVKEKFEDRKSYEKYKGLIYIYEPLTNEIAKEILEKLFIGKKFADGGTISDIKMKVRELQREARGLEPGDPDRMRIFSTIAKLKIEHPELNRIFAEGGELKKKIDRYPDLDKIQPTMIAKRGAVIEQGLFDTYQPVKPTIVSKEPKKKMPGNLTEEISEVDIVRLGVTSLPKGTERKIKSSLDASKILYSVFPKDQIAVQEFYYALFLNNNNDVIAYYNLSKGGVTSTIADVELLASVSVKLLAKGVITAHNHPSGNLKPSQADIQLAKKTRDALKLLDITMLDSLIIVPNGDQGNIKYTSLMDEDLM